MERINLILDGFLVFAAIWMVIACRKRSEAGSIFQRALLWITLGLLLFAVAQPLEVVLAEQLGWEADLVELFHRILHIISFIMFAFGLRRLHKLYN